MSEIKYYVDSDPHNCTLSGCHPETCGGSGGYVLKTPEGETIAHSTVSHLLQDRADRLNDNPPAVHKVVETRHQQPTFSRNYEEFVRNTKEDTR